LAAISLILQIRRLYQTKSPANISFIYLLFSVFSATEQLHMAYFFFLRNKKAASAVSQKALVTSLIQTSEGWLDLFQVTAVWMAMSFVL
jgi:hypothetical protein